MMNRTPDDTDEFAHMYDEVLLVGLFGKSRQQQYEFTRDFKETNAGAPIARRHFRNNSPNYNRPAIKLSSAATRTFRRLEEIATLMRRRYIPPTRPLARGRGHPGGGVSVPASRAIERSDRNSAAGSNGRSLRGRSES